MSLIWLNEKAKMVDAIDTEGNEVEYQGMNEAPAQKIKESFEAALTKAARIWWNNEGTQLYDFLFEFQTYEHEGDIAVSDLLFHHVKDLAQDLSMPWALENQEKEKNSKPLSNHDEE